MLKYNRINIITIKQIDVMDLNIIFDIVPNN